MKLFKPFLICLLVAGCVWAFVCRPYRINSSGMEDTLQKGDFILSLRKHVDRSLHKDEVIIYKGEIDGRQCILSGRIKGMPGDSIRLNGSMTLESHITGKRAAYKTDLYKYPIEKEDTMLGILARLDISNKLEGVEQDFFLRNFTTEEAEKIKETIGRQFDLQLYDEGKAQEFIGIKVPKKGDVVEIDDNNRLIIYNTLRHSTGQNATFKDGEIYINGKAVKKVRFNEDYLWIAGDNILCHTDSRSIGFVQAGKVVGKPVLIWFSKGEKGIRPERILRTIK